MAPAGHPRACGENNGAASPLVWVARAIPARAGRTSSKGLEQRRAHGPSPRVRGELPPLAGAVLGALGPSPRVRGERAAAVGWRSRRAGHPRACGENYCAANPDRCRQRAIPARAGRTVGCLLTYQMVIGPSPRVRGERLSTSHGISDSPGHPRACGENSSCAASFRPVAGPSPRVRGELAPNWSMMAGAVGPSPRVRGERAGAPQKRW